MTTEPDREPVQHVSQVDPTGETAAGNVDRERGDRTRWCCGSLTLDERESCARVGIGCNDRGRCARKILDGIGGDLDEVS